MKRTRISESHSIPISRLGKRERVFLSIAVVSLVLGTTGVLSSLLVKSPAQKAAETSPPPYTVLTAPVQERVLENTIGVRGSVVATASVNVRPAIGGQTNGVVTAIPKAAGDMVSEGEVVAQISGRPVIALEGAVPAYRDLLPGATGADVRQFQAALQRLGLIDAEDVDGLYGAATQRAVHGLYDRLGATPRSTADLNSGEAGERRGLEAEVRAAERALAETEAAAADASANPGASRAWEFAAKDLKVARAALDALEKTTGIYLPVSEVVYVATFPSTISAVGGDVGTAVADLADPLIVLQTGELTVRALVPPGNEAQISQGQRVRIVDDVKRTEVAGTVADLGQFQSASASKDDKGAVSPDGYPIEVAPTEPLGSEWLGRDVRLVITTERTADPVLVVPLTAISSLPDGSSYVVVAADGEKRRVTVEVGLVASGAAALTSITQGALRAGDTVVVG